MGYALTTLSKSVIYINPDKKYILLQHSMQKLGRTGFTIMSFTYVPFSIFKLNYYLEILKTNDAAM